MADLVTVIDVTSKG